MTPGKNPTLRLCSPFPRKMQIMLVLPWLEHNRKTHWVSLCLFTSTSNFFKGCLNLTRETSGRSTRCPRMIFQPRCSFPCWWARHSSGNLYSCRKKPSLLLYSCICRRHHRHLSCLDTFGHDVPLLNFHRVRSTFSEVKLCIRSPECDFQKKSAQMLLVQASADINRDRVSPALT